MEKIYFKNAEKTTTLEELLRLGYADDMYFTETFADSEFKFQQCGAKSRRSFEDLLAIANTYFPNTTEEDLMLALTKLKFIKFYYCWDVEKIVFHGAGIYKIPDFNLLCQNPEYYKENTYLPQKLKQIYENIKFS